jgi:hypothetical protein
MQKRQIKVGNSALAVGSGDRSEGEEGVGSGGRKIFIQRLCTLAHFVVVPLRHKLGVSLVHGV